jgi:hypothetical protein
MSKTPRRVDVRRLYYLILLGAIPLAPSGVAAQSRCGVQRWPVKIWADDDAAKVDTVPVPITVAELVKLPRPGTPFRNRVAILGLSFPGLGGAASADLLPFQKRPP